MEIQKLAIGPIVGYATATSCRIFGGGKEVVTERAPARGHGLARVRQKGSSTYERTTIFKMNPLFDFTGVTEFNGLQPNREYDFQVGILYDEREQAEILAEAGRAGGVDWAHASQGSFRTVSEAADQPINFVFGSCRYMLKLGTFLFDTRGDKIFRSIVDLMDEQGISLDHCLMLGDQIYADDLNLIEPDNTVAQYNQRYRIAFSQPHIAGLMRRLSSYMILDDHEIEDNWPGKANARDNQLKYPAALHAYQTYQVSHSPVMEMQEGKIVASPDRFWYCFSNGCADFFVMDTRTERYLPELESEKMMVSSRQMEALKQWLNNGSGKIKFVASGVPVFPDVKTKWEDKWRGFLVQRTELLNFIKDNSIQKVVFLSGDVHSSLSAQLVSSDGAPCKIISVISSSFFWPVPIFRSKGFQLSGPLQVVGSTKFEVQNTSQIVSEDNFTLVTAAPEKLTITVYNRKGRIIDGPYDLSL